MGIKHECFWNTINRNLETHIDTALLIRQKFRL